jgi:hypothetical protein
MKKQRTSQNERHASDSCSGCDHPCGTLSPQAYLNITLKSTGYVKRHGISGDAVSTKKSPPYSRRRAFDRNR